MAAIADLSMEFSAHVLLKIKTSASHHSNGFCSLTGGFVAVCGVDPLPKNFPLTASRNSTVQD
jgi:hypothetical protein